MDYDDLISLTPGIAFARNADLISAMPDLVARAETYVINRLDHDAFRAVADPVAFPGGAETFDLPVDLLELRALRVRFKGRGWIALRKRDEEMLAALFATARPGEPRFYATSGPNRVTLYPTPPRSYDGLLVGNFAPPPLSPTNLENELTRRYWEIIRAATLREAAVYMSDDQLIGTYGAETGDLLTAANMAIARNRRDEVTERPRDTANAKGS